MTKHCHLLKGRLLRHCVGRGVTYYIRHVGCDVARRCVRLLVDIQWTIVEEKRNTKNSAKNKNYFIPVFISPSSRYALLDTADLPLTIRETTVDYQVQSGFVKLLALFFPVVSLRPLFWFFVVSQNCPVSTSFRGKKLDAEKWIENKF